MEAAEPFGDMQLEEVRRRQAKVPSTSVRSREASMGMQGRNRTREVAGDSPIMSGVGLRRHHPSEPREALGIDYCAAMRGAGGILLNA